MIRAIIFDCFGVILADALERAAAELRLRDPQAALELLDVISAANHGLIDVASARVQIAGLLGLTVQEYAQQIVAGNLKDEQLLAYIRSLRKTYKTGMLSNVGKGSLLQRFDPDELASTFDVVVASGEIGYAKPEPQAYEITAEQLGLPPQECIFTDDRPEYCDGARAVGMQAIHYRSYSQFKAELEDHLQI